MYFSFPVYPPICLLGFNYEYHRGPKGIFLQMHFDCLWSNGTETTKEHLTPLEHRNGRRRNSSELAMDLPVRYNNVLLTGPLSSNKGEECRTVRTMHLPGFFSFGAACVHISPCGGHAKLPGFISDVY